MSETEQIFVVVLTTVGFLASIAQEASIEEKVFLVIAPLVMWFFWRNLIRWLKA